MAEIRKSNILNAVKKYYNTLSKVGSVSQNDCYKILVAMFLCDLINSDMSFFITENDYDKIGRLYRAMIGGCILPYDQFCLTKTQIGSPLIHVEGMGVTMMSEDDKNRFVEFNAGNRVIETLTWITDNGL